jgi:hypothetical protein
METLETYAQYCQNYIANHLDNLKGETFDSNLELAISLYEYDNINGSMTYSTYQAQDFIKSWFYNVGLFIEQYQNDLGEIPQHNPFTQPELFHCLMVIYGVQNILASVSMINDNQEPFTLTQEIIEHIKKEIKNYLPLTEYFLNDQGN